MTEKKETRSDEEVEKIFGMITKNLQEVVGEDKIKEVLKERNLKIYWGTAPTGAPHLGYFVPILKIGEFLKAGQNVTILFADVHAALDNLKSTFEIVEKRTIYYEFLIREMLKSVGVPLDKLKFVKGSTFQYEQEYTKKMYRLASITNLAQSKHSGADVVKQCKDPLLSGLLYPLLQALDEEFLGVDAQFGGVDQRKIFMYAREYLPKIGLKKRIHLMNPLIPGLTKTGKMSSSEPNSKVDFFDSDEVIKKKFNKAFSVDGEVIAKVGNETRMNCLLAIIKYILMEKIINEKRKFQVKRDEKYGGNLEFSDYESIEEAFKNGDLLSGDLKKAVAEEIILLISPLREILKKNQKIFDDCQYVKKGKSEKPKKKSGYEKFCEEKFEEHKNDEEFKGMKSRALKSAIKKKLNLGKLWGKMSPEERKKYE